LPAHLSARPPVSIPALDAFQLQLTPFNSTPRDENIVDVTSYDELKAAIDAGKWARGGWEGSDADEEKVKEDTGATIRCFPLDQPAGSHTCLMTGVEAKEVCLFAKSY
jgi:prolyl-tRNA synthetase